MGDSSNSSVENQKRKYGPDLPPLTALYSDGKDREGVKRPRSKSPTGARRSKRSDVSRENWMTQPPEPKMRANPANVKSRQFSRKGGHELSVDFGWVNEPKDKSQSKKTEDEADLASSDAQQMADADEKAAIINEYNSRYRPESLMQIHQREYQGEKVAEGKTDRLEKRFDWSRDMNTTKQVSKEYLAGLLQKSGDLSSRFSNSKKRFL